LVWQILVSSR